MCVSIDIIWYGFNGFKFDTNGVIPYTVLCDFLFPIPLFVQLSHVEAFIVLLYIPTITTNTTSIAVVAINRFYF